MLISNFEKDLFEIIFFLCSFFVVKFEQSELNMFQNDISNTRRNILISISDVNEERTTVLSRTSIERDNLDDT